jgi:hypothetical protein
MLSNSAGFFSLPLSWSFDVIGDGNDVLFVNVIEALESEDVTG